MRYVSTWRALCVVALCWVNGDQAMGEELTAIDVVNQRMDAYNAHDMDAFLEVYSHDVVIYSYPDIALGKGHEHLEKIFAAMFKAEMNHVEIKIQIERQEYVINDEIVTYGDLSVRYVSIYEVRDGLITSVRFVGKD